MSSPEDSFKLAQQLQERQASRRQFPTLATRGYGRKQRPSLKGSSLDSVLTREHSFNFDDGASPSGSRSSSRQHVLLQSTTEASIEGADGAEPHNIEDQAQPQQPITLPDDDDEEAGKLELDYASPGPTSTQSRPTSPSSNLEQGDDGERKERSLAAELFATSPPAGGTKRRRRRSTLLRSNSSSSTGKLSTTSSESLPIESTQARKKRPTLPRAESSGRDSIAVKRMTVLVEGEMPEGGMIDEDEEEDRDPERETLKLIGDENESSSINHQDKQDTEPVIVDPSLQDDKDQQGSPADDANFSVEDEDEEADEEEEEEEVEPSLKYSRVKGSVADVLKKDTASAFAISSRFMALGTHAGMIYILDIEGNLVKGFRHHTASILDIVIDTTSEFIGAASMDGLVSISALSATEQYIFDFKRPMRAIALEPNFGRKSSRAFVCGGMAGNLIHKEKSWFGHKETILHSGDGPIWTVKWRQQFVVWATDKGVRVYDTAANQRISYISPPQGSNTRGDLFRCTLYWQDDRTLLIAWADHIKVAKIREKTLHSRANASSAASISSSHRGKTNNVASMGGTAPSSSSQPQFFVEITAIFQLDCMISGIAPYGLDYLVLAYITEDDLFDNAEPGSSHESTRRKAAVRPELRIISRAGEELSSDVLSLTNYARYQCNDYLLVPSVEARAYSAALLAGKKIRADSDSSSIEASQQFYVVSPSDMIVSRPRDEKDHISWLLERSKFQEALVKVEGMGRKRALENGFDAEEIGKKYLNFLVNENEFQEAARVASKILGRDAAAWEEWIFLFVEKGKLGLAIPYIPTSDPTLSGLVYDMILAHFLQSDPERLLTTIQDWPIQIYSVQAVVLAIEDKLNRRQDTSNDDSKTDNHEEATKLDDNESRILMECLAEIFIKNRQPSKALPYLLRLRKENVFDLIRENNLFTSVQDQALLLIQFEEDLRKHGKGGPGQVASEGGGAGRAEEKSVSRHGLAIELLVDHIYSIPINRVIQQLEGHPKYLFWYLDALFEREAGQMVQFSDLMVKLYAEYEPSKLMRYLRSQSSHYSFEKAYSICNQHDYVPEMVFLLGRVGDNKRALSLIIERLGDVERAIDFAKEQADQELWEDLLTYSETRPNFIRALLENIDCGSGGGASIDPVRLIKRIKNGLEIPHLKQSLIKVLHDFSIQISLLEGSQRILEQDCRIFSQQLYRSSSYATFFDPLSNDATPTPGGQDGSICSACDLPLFSHKETTTSTVAMNGNGATNGAIPVEEFAKRKAMKKVVLFLCGHTYHLGCLVPFTNLPTPPVPPTTTSGIDVSTTTSQTFSSSISNRKRWSEMDSKAIHSNSVSSGGAKLPYGPAWRDTKEKEAFGQRLRYEARLRPVVKRNPSNCPTCTGNSTSTGTQFH